MVTSLLQRLKSFFRRNPDPEFIASQLRRLKSFFRRNPDPEFIASQLRKPEGEFAPTIADKMDQVNAPLFDLTLDCMRIQDNEKILEIGFGSGQFLYKCFERADTLQVCGIDYSSEMVELARKNNFSRVQSKEMILREGNSNNIPFPEQTFDKVFCNMVVFFWQRPQDHLREIHRVLKPNGRFYTGIRPREDMERIPASNYGFKLYDPAQWDMILRVNGFDVIGIERRKDPRKEFEDMDLEMESVCIMAEKKPF